MAGSSVTITRTPLGDILKVKFVWVSDDAAGTASGATTFPVVGVLMRMTTIPAAAGAAPTALYDITIKDEDGVDVLNGLGADRSATATETKTNIDGLGLVAANSLTLAVANAGNSKGGTVRLLFLNAAPNQL